MFENDNKRDMVYNDDYDNLSSDDHWRWRLRKIDGDDDNNGDDDGDDGNLVTGGLVLSNAITQLCLPHHSNDNDDDNNDDNDDDNNQISLLQSSKQKRMWERVNEKIIQNQCQLPKEKKYPLHGNNRQTTNTEQNVCNIFHF